MMIIDPKKYINYDLNRIFQVLCYFYSMLLLLLIQEIIKENNAITFEDGNILFERISEVIKYKGKVELDFSQITSISATFLSASVGQLHEHFSDDAISRSLTITNLKDDYKDLLSNVIMRSKVYKQDSESFEDIVENVIYGD